MRAALERAERNRAQSEDARDAAAADGAEAPALIAGAAALDERLDATRRDVDNSGNRQLGEAVSREALADSLAGVAEAETVQAPATRSSAVKARHSRQSISRRRVRH